MFNEQIAPASNSDEESSDTSSESTQSDVSSLGHQPNYININVHINDGIIFIFKMVYISVKYVPLPLIPPTVIAIDLAQGYLRKTDSISSKMIHNVFPGRKNSQVYETPSIHELREEVKYRTKTREFQVVDTNSKIPPGT